MAITAGEIKAQAKEVSEKVKKIMSKAAPPPPPKEGMKEEKKEEKMEAEEKGAQPEKMEVE